MKIKCFIYSICSILSFSVLITSCSRISDDAEKYVGEWKFCHTNDDEQNPFWQKESVLTFLLKQNGDWILGMDKGQGQWGNNAKNIGKVCDLDFDESKVNSPHGNQIQYLSASIIELQGIKVLDFKVDFSYEGWGTFDHSTEGATVTSSKKYNANVHYYYVKTSDENLKLSKFFKEELFKEEFEIIKKTNLDYKPKQEFYNNDIFPELDLINNSIIKEELNNYMKNINNWTEWPEYDLWKNNDSNKSSWTVVPLIAFGCAGDA